MNACGEITESDAGPSGASRLNQDRSLWGIVRRRAAATGRNHALEHATIHILTRTHPTVPLMGRSTPSGFYIYGEVSTDAVEEAVAEGISRLIGGEAHLAVHPRCGTNLAVGALVSGIAASLALGRRRRPWWEEFPQVLLATSLGLLLAQPLGYSVQQHVTTRTDVQTVRVVGIQRQTTGRHTTHCVRLESD